MTSRTTNQEHMAKVAAIGCVLCRRPAEVHHILEGRNSGARSDDEQTIPLCEVHHRTGGHGVAIHDGAEKWRSLFGSELALLKHVGDILEMDHGPDYDPKATRQVRRKVKHSWPTGKIQSRGFAR